MTASFKPSRRAILLTTTVAAGLFLAGFGYGYAMPLPDADLGIFGPHITDCPHWAANA